LDNEDSRPRSHIEVRLIAPTYEWVAYTDEQGNYSFHNIHSGNYTLIATDTGYFESSMDIDYVAGERKSIRDIFLEQNTGDNSMNIDIPAIEQSDDESSRASSPSTVSLLNANRDIFAYNAASSLSQGGFRARGFLGQDQKMLINGIPMENILRGHQINYSDFAGLNDVLRTKTNYYGIKAIPFAFGQVTNTAEIDAEAIQQRNGLRLSQWIANRNFTSRTSLTYNTGLLKSDFAFSASFSYRGASEAYTPGTSMSALSGFFSISRKWNHKLTTSLSAIVTDNQRAVSKASTKEFYLLAGTNYYNPNWGYDGTEKRSANVRRDNVPMVILSGDLKPVENTTISMSAAFQHGKRYSEKLDWYNSYSPDPSYYRNAPSYYRDDPILYAQTYANIVNHREVLQIDWRRLRDANSSNHESVPFSNTEGKWARYLLYKDVSKVANATLNMNVKHQLNNTMAFHGGATAQRSSTESFKEVSDLLGADFFVNINQFASRSNPSNPLAIHNDVNHPYGILKKGDKYGYDAISNALNFSGWGQATLSLKKIDAFAAVKLENTKYWREGLYKNGAYLNTSFGTSSVQSFVNASFKMGMTYKHNGKNYVSLNFSRFSEAPQFSQVFVLARTANIVDPNVQSNSVSTIEWTYHYRSATLKAYFAGFYTMSENENEVKTTYTELANSFGTLVLTNMNKRYMGIETAVEYKIGHSGLTALALASMGDYVYSNRPNLRFYYDNFDQVTASEKVYFQGLHLASGPQITGLLKLSYASKKFWNASLSVNYFDKMYVDPSPQRRTQEAIDNIDPQSALYSKILTQEHLPGAFTVDAFFRKSILIRMRAKKIQSRMHFNIILSVNNILDYQNFAMSGFEQLRFDFKENNPEKYPNRYTYMMGRTFALNLLFTI
jgi:hypothetical protein